MAVSATIGVMRPLLGKLAALAGDEYSNLKGVRKQASLLERELRAMNADLEKMELMDELDPWDRDWRDHVRELTYDMENCIDDFMLQVGGSQAKVGFIKKTTQRLKMVEQRIAGQMEELKSIAVKANARRIRYKIDDCNVSSSLVTNDPRTSVIYVEAVGLVGIDVPTEELVTLLTDTEEKLKVVSIVGFGGLGKTTLARRAYDEIEGQFDCTTFIQVSQSPNMTEFMTGLLYRFRTQLDLEIDGSSHDREVQDLIDDIRKCLTHKRYLIVVDDLWDQTAWNIIRDAFPENANGSRVIVTTRVEGVAYGACYSRPECIYRMKPLDEQDSKQLLFHRVYGSKDDHPSRYEEISAEILKKCGGLPLAIITIGSLLGSHPEKLRSGWERVKNSLGVQFAVTPTLGRMRSILNLSYIHLPLYLRACFLHLGMYPEDREIERDDLVRQWLVEGFVSNLHGPDMEVVAKSYFNELVNRSLIQPGRTEYGEVVSCSVHAMMLDLIVTKCAELNFVRVVCNSEGMSTDHGWIYETRRILMNFNGCGAADEVASGTIPSSLSQVRSLAHFGRSKYMPPLLHFKHLRVIQIWEERVDMTIDLSTISQLFQLRYLKVSVYGHIELPTEMQGLVHLETLDLDCHGRLEIPSDVVQLPCLSHLIVRTWTRLPKGIRNMKSLHTLDGFEIGCSSLEDIEGLGELTNLRCLGLSKSRLGNPHTSKFGTAEAGALASSIGRLHDLRYLRIDGNLFNMRNILESLSDPFRHMKILKMYGLMLPRVPRWIYGLECLSCLELFVNTCTDEFHDLGKLPSLVHLKLWLWSLPEEKAVIFSTGSFPVLEDFRCSSMYDVTAYLAFEAGAMPKLRRIKLGFKIDQWGGATPVGLEHLLRLENIVVRVTSCSRKVRQEANSAFMNCTQLHPSRPSSIVLP